MINNLFVIIVHQLSLVLIVAPKADKSHDSKNNSNKMSKTSGVLENTEKPAEKIHVTLEDDKPKSRKKRKDCSD